MKFQKALRLQKMPPYVFSEINKKKKLVQDRGIQLIDLGMGDPDLATPLSIVEAHIEAVRKVENQRYPSYPGMPEFRNAVSHWMEKRFSVHIDPEKEAAALIGSKEGIAHFVLATVNPGDFV